MPVMLESAFNEDMLDLYLYYCVIGLGMPSQQLRAACLSILPIAASQNPELVLSKLDLLEHAGNADWWEVHAQLVVVYAAVLDVIDCDNAQVEQVYALLDKTISRCSSPDVLKIALSHLAPCLATHPSLGQLYAKILFDIPNVMLSGSNMVPGLLNDSNIHALSVPSDMPISHYRLVSLPSEWNATIVASGVASELRSRGLVNLSLQHMEILHACLKSGSMSADDKAAWSSVFAEVKDFLYVALCDVDVCAVAIEVLRTLFAGLDSGEVKATFEIMTKSLKLLYPSGDEVCRGAVGSFLADVMNMNAEYKEALSTELGTLPGDIKAAPELASLM